MSQGVPPSPTMLLGLQLNCASGESVSTRNIVFSKTILQTYSCPLFYIKTYIWYVVVRLSYFRHYFLTHITDVERRTAKSYIQAIYVIYTHIYINIYIIYSERYFINLFDSKGSVLLRIQWINNTHCGQPWLLYYIRW